MNLTLNILDVDNKTFSGNYQLSQYGGKELDRENGLDWLDFEARHYDPMLPQFNSMDRKAEDYSSSSPFAYCAGNPIRYNDPTGKDAELVINGNNIVFNVNIILIGKNITDDIINTYKNDLLKTWGTMTSYTSESGIKYDIEWNIDVHALKKGELFNYEIYINNINGNYVTVFL